MVNSLNNNNLNGQQKTILVIDWSNLMFRSLFLHKLYNGNVSGYEREEDLKSFCYKFATDICCIVNTIHPVHTIICTDSQSAWRKQILPGDNGYKANREKDPSVNWDNIYKCSDDLLHILERKAGMTVASVDHAEADDMIACVKEVIFERFPEYSMVIVSADADIRQLIEFDPTTKQYCIVYNTTTKPSTKKKHMYVTQGFRDWLQAPEVCDIFFTGHTMNDQKQYVNDILNTNTTIELVVDDPDSVLLGKILCGDDGDNVPAFYSFYKNERVIRVTPKRAEKIMSLIEAKTVRDLCEKVDGVAEAMGKVFKRTVDDVDCRERLNRQRVLVELNTSLFPQNIRDYKETIAYMLKAIRPCPYVQLKSADILRGTEYEGYDKKRALEADIFRDIEKLTGSSRKKPPVPKTPAHAPVPGPNSLFNVDGLF